MIKSYKDLQIYQISYKLALDVHLLTRSFPKEELYSLTDQIRRSSRSICANIVEGWFKRKYKNIFIRHLTDALGSNGETKFWLEFCKDLKYLKEEDYNNYYKKYDELGAKIQKLSDKWRNFENKKSET